MIRLLLTVAVLSLGIENCKAFSEHAADLDLSELKRIEGVEIFLQEETGSTTVTIELMKSNGFLGQSHFKGFPEVFLWEVVLSVCDDNDNVMVTAPLKVLSEVGGSSLSSQSKSGFTMITFTVASKLLPKSRLRFDERVTHGRQWTDVYFGSKPKPK